MRVNRRIRLSERRRIGARNREVLYEFVTMTHVDVSTETTKIVEHGSAPDILGETRQRQVGAVERTATNLGLALGVRVACGRTQTGPNAWQAIESLGARQLDAADVAALVVVQEGLVDVQVGIRRRDDAEIVRNIVARELCRTLDE